MRASETAPALTAACQKISYLKLQLLDNFTYGLQRHFVLTIHNPPKGLELASWIMYCILPDRKYDWFVFENIFAAFLSLLFKIYKYFGITQNVNLCRRQSGFCKAMCFLQDISCICQAEKPTEMVWKSHFFIFFFLFLVCFFVLLQNESTMTPYAATIAENDKSNTFSQNSTKNHH